MEFWPHRRAKRQLPRVRSWPSLAEPSFSGIVAFKVGMTHVNMIDDSSSPSKGSEIARPATILEAPSIFVYGIRFYRNGTYKEPALDIYFPDYAKKFGIKNAKHKMEEMQKLKENPEIIDATCLMFFDPSLLDFGNKALMRFEVPVGGKSVSEKADFISKWLGKEVKLSDVIKEGDYIDVTAVSKGKGWAGVIKRFGVARLMRKATGKIRHVGVLGPWHPPKVMFTVPHAGHMGYNYRTEINKRVLKAGASADTNQVNAKGGFLNYGNVKGDYIVVDGSIPGPAKRLVRIRKALRPSRQPQKPNILQISVKSRQGA